MNAQLVKIDVAAAMLRWPIRRIESCVDGGTLLDRGFAWVWNLANDPTGERRDLRFWFPEVSARACADSTKQRRFQSYELEWVINKILPPARKEFHAGEVDQLLQVRHNTRIDFGPELNGAMKGGRNFYSRAVLAQFLRCRWIGAHTLPAKPDQAVNGLGRAVPAAGTVRLVNPASTSSVAASGGNIRTGLNFPKSPIASVESGRSEVENEAGHSLASPRAAALKRADTNKPGNTTHAAQFSKTLP